MIPNSTLNRTDFEDFLLRLYFGPDQDGLTACINRAYLDFNRTLHGFAKLTNRKDVHVDAVAVLKDSLEKLASLTAKSMNNRVFDSWHKESCLALIELYKERKYHLYIGQAQKWVNMSLKYIFTFGNGRIPGFIPAFQYCHVPIDNIILKRFCAGYKMQKLRCAWSRIDNYDYYLCQQEWIRKTFPNFPPLEVEFRLWMSPATLPHQSVLEQNRWLDVEVSSEARQLTNT